MSCSDDGDDDGTSGLAPRPTSHPSLLEWELCCARRSCINMSVMEPCVEKAVYNLERLAEKVEELRKKRKEKEKKRNGANKEERVSLVGGEGGRGKGHQSPLSTRSRKRQGADKPQSERLGDDYEREPFVNSSIDQYNRPPSWPLAPFQRTQTPQTLPSPTGGRLTPSVRVTFTEPSTPLPPSPPPPPPGHDDDNDIRGLEGAASTISGVRPPEEVGAAHERSCYKNQTADRHLDTSAHVHVRVHHSASTDSPMPTCVQRGEAPAGDGGSKRTDREAVKHVRSSKLSISQRTIDGNEESKSLTVGGKDLSDVGHGPRDLVVEGRHIGAKKEDIDGGAVNEVAAPTTTTTASELLGEDLAESELSDWSEVDDDVIAGTVRLVARLEGDRQSTMAALEREREKVRGFQASLDEAYERRQFLLPAAVQLEHEQCIRDILELKWHLSYGTRQLTRVKHDIRKMKERNVELKKEVASLEKNCPLMKEMLSLEKAQIEEVNKQQEKTSEELNKAKHLLFQTQDKANKMESKAAAERREMERELGDVREKLRIASMKLTGANTEHLSVTSHMNTANDILVEREATIHSLEEKIADVVSDVDAAKARVSDLKDEKAEMDARYLELQARKLELEDQKDQLQQRLDEWTNQLMAELEKKEKAMRDSKDLGEDLERVIEALKEKIVVCNRRSEENLKSVERAKKELVRLDQQLQVSLHQYSKVREDNHHLTETIKEEETRLGDIEFSLKSTIENLEKQIKEERKTKITYENKIESGNEDLERKRVDAMKKLEQAVKIAQDTEMLDRKQSDIVITLEKTSEEKHKVEDGLRSDLKATKMVLAVTEKDLSDKRDSLLSEKRGLELEVEEQKSSITSSKERIRLCERKIGDVDKSSTMFDRVEQEHNTAIEELTEEIEALKEKVGELKREEESWKEEYKEISDFSCSADEKHECYVRERTDLLKQYELDLAQLLEANTTLSREYCLFQKRYVDIKARSLRVMEKKLELEASLRDHTQLMAFQCRIRKVMEAYYERRSLLSKQCLREFCQRSRANHAQLQELHSHMELVVEAMRSFLENGGGGGGGGGGGKMSLSSPVPAISSDSSNTSMTTTTPSTASSSGESLAALNTGKATDGRAIVGMHGSLALERRDLEDVAAVKESKSVRFKLPVECS